VLGGILEWIFRYIFGAVFELHFSPLFGPRSVCDLAILRGFLGLDSCFWALFSPTFHRAFHRAFHQRCHLSGLHEAGFQVLSMPGASDMYLVGVVGVHYS
jgi:hypothetical protein